MNTEDKVKTAYNQGYRITKEGIVLNPKGYKMPAGIGTGGYNNIRVTINGKSKHIRIHRLQAYQKYGDDMFNNGIVVRHLSNNKQNNTWDNILIGTHKENYDDMPSDIRKQVRVKAGVTKRKYDYKAIKLFHETSPSYKCTMINFNIKYKATLARILKKNSCLA